MMIILTHVNIKFTSEFKIVIILSYIKQSFIYSAV